MFFLTLLVLGVIGRGDLVVYTVSWRDCQRCCCGDFIPSHEKRALASLLIIIPMDHATGDAMRNHTPTTPKELPKKKRQTHESRTETYKEAGKRLSVNV